MLFSQPGAYAAHPAGLSGPLLLSQPAEAGCLPHFPAIERPSHRDLAGAASPGRGPGRAGRPPSPGHGPTAECAISTLANARVSPVRLPNEALYPHLAKRLT